MRLALIWFCLALLAKVLRALDVDLPFGSAPLLALGAGFFTTSWLRSRPLKKRIFGTSAVLRVVLPGLLYASGLAAALLEMQDGASKDAGGGFVLGASLAAGLVLWLGVMRSAPPEGEGLVRYVCARCGLGADREEGREPCVHCGLFTRIEWNGELPATEEGQSPFTRLWCPACAEERAAPRGTSECGSCGQALHIEFNDHATGALESGDGRGIEAR